MNTKDYFQDAIPSWSGFQYQGKVGLFTLLKYTTSNYVSNLELELEWLEDFSIINDGKYKSIHQVKAYSSSQLSAYSSAIRDLAVKLMGLIPSNVFVRFFPKIKKEKRKILVDELKNHLTKELIIDSNNRIITRDVNLISSLNFNNHQLKKVENTIKRTIIFYCKLKEDLHDINAYLHTVKPINFNRKILLKQPKIAALKAKNLVSQREFDDILDRIIPYKGYGISKDCCPNTIGQLNIDIINKNYLYRDKKYFGVGNRDLAKKIHTYLLGLFDKYVSQRHSDKIYRKQLNNSNGIQIVPNIAWSTLLDVITKSDEIVDESTMRKKAFVLREQFDNQFQKEIERLNRKITDEDELSRQYTKIRDRLDYITAHYPQEYFLNFCKSISPRRDSKNFRLDGVVSILNPSDGLKNPYFKFFGEVTKELGDGENHKFEFNKNFYLPTIIRGDDGYEVARDIVENDNAPDTVYETDYIITKELYGKTIQQFLNEITRDMVDEEDLEELEQHRITKIKSIELIDINTAIKRFNDDKST